MFKPIISSDSHVCEPPDLYVDRIDKKYLADAVETVPGVVAELCDPQVVGVHAGLLVVVIGDIADFHPYLSLIHI